MENAVALNTFRSARATRPLVGLVFMFYKLLLHNQLLKNTRQLSRQC